VTGEVVSGAATITEINTLTPLLELAGAAITVSVSAGAELIELVIHNDTGQDLPAVLEEAAPAGGGTTAAIALTAGGDTKLRLGPASAANSLHLQIFPSGALTQVVTLIVSSEEAAKRAPVSVVGQAFIGVG
jgi:hypothetical protein